MNELIRTEITVLPADPPGKRLIGWMSWICSIGGHHWLYRNKMPRALIRHIEECASCKVGFLQGCPAGCIMVWDNKKR
jgi:hypothetical protein